MLTHIVVRESSSDIQDSPMCLSVCMQTCPSCLLDSQCLSSIGALSVITAMRTDGETLTRAERHLIQLFLECSDPCDFVRVPLMTLRTKWAHRLERDLQTWWAGFLWGPFFHVVPAAGKGGWEALYLWKGHLSGLTPVRRHSPHCVWETLSHAKFFFLSVLSAVSLNRGSVCASLSIY